MTYPVMLVNSAKCHVSLLVTWKTYACFGHVMESTNTGLCLDLTVKIFTVSHWIYRHTFEVLNVI